jgi:hypothetical protein
MRSLLISLLLLAAIAAPARAAPLRAPPEGAVFYDVSEKLGALATAHFTADFIALITQKSLEALGVDPNIHVYVRKPARVFGLNEQPLPGLGCWAGSVRTQAVSQGERENQLLAHYEYLCRGADADIVLAQAELAAEVLLRLIDRFGTAGSGIEGGGHEPQSVLGDIDGSGPADGLEVYEQWVHVVSPIWDTDAIP